MKVLLEIEAQVLVQVIERLERERLGTTNGFDLKRIDRDLERVRKDLTQNRELTRLM